MGTEDNSNRPGQTIRDIGWKPVRKNYFPPPKGLPDYATRPLPPPPSSSSSSNYDLDQGFQSPTQHHLLKGAQEDSRSRPQDQDEIASPQPRYPEHKVLKIKTDDSIVSPILTPPSGKNSHYQYRVSPLSPDGSTHSFETAVSEFERSSNLRPNSWSKEKDPVGTEGRHSSQGDNTPDETGAGFQPLTVQKDSLHPRLQKINLRYSDPGSPVQGTIDPRNFGEPGPDVGSSARSSQRRTAEAQPAASQPQPQQSKRSQHDSWSHSPMRGDSATEGRKVSFARGNIDSFSHRTTASGPRHAPAPLKLNERPLAENYIKTPFPPRTNSDYSQKSVFEEDDVDKKQNRRSSGLSSFAKSFRPTSFHKSDSNNSFTQNEGRKHHEEHTKASPVPMVKNIISKAKSGFKIGSDESKKEKRRENLKRQIKVEPVEK